MSKIKVAINGFGRIGRQFFKVAIAREDLEIVAINDLGDISNLAYLLEFDSVYGRFNGEVKVGDGTIIVNGKTIKFLQETDATKLPWAFLGIDVVIESTGRFTSYDKAKVHLDAGAKRVVLSAPAKDDQTPTSTPNVNVAACGASKITSNASCTTNSITPLAAILSKNPGIKYSMVSTVHGYTAEQSLVDGPMPALHKDFRRGRAAGVNIVPTSSGATLAAARAVPYMKDKFDGLALRVPVPAGSILDFNFVSLRPTSVEEINNILIEESKKPEWQGIFTVTDRPLVSSDVLGNPHGAIVDLNLTRVVGGELVKVMAWYDNEMGYANMLYKHIIGLALFL
ncbi:MAG: type I glyceraldehyde-3-phosphate dehydrogenase [Candidatus Vogelbacteria bacterium]|nr:type I glyceraldehyde-3-phosphate dehydrogenase [Candidatus Vogelbacteria bacterium]